MMLCNKCHVSLQILNALISYQMEKFKRPKQTKEEKADSDLRQLLNYSDVSDTETIRGKNTWRRTRDGKEFVQYNKINSCIVYCTMTLSKRDVIYGSFRYGTVVSLEYI